MCILTSYCFYGVQWLRIIHSKESTRLGASFTENRNRNGFWNVVLLYKSIWWTNPPKNIVSVNIRRVLFLFLIWRWDRKVVPKPLYAVYYPRKVQISHDNLVMQALVWLCMVKFRAARFDASYANLRWPHIFKHHISGKKNLILHSSNYGNFSPNISAALQLLLLWHADD
jgi:hypothetical protein